MSGPQDQRSPAADEVSIALVHVAGHAEDVVGRFYERLHRVMLDVNPTPTIAGEKVIREFPPLFSDMLNRIDLIEHQLGLLEDMLKRLEI